MIRTALAVWQGNFKLGRGTFTIQDSAICNIPFSYKSRFQNETAISPEGLLAAAHAASFAMSFAKHLESRTGQAERIDIVTTIYNEDINGLNTVTQIDLELTVHTHSSHHELIEEAAHIAKKECSISRLFNTQINLNVMIRDQSSLLAA